MPSRINIGPENGPYVGINEENGNLQLEDNSGNVVAEWDETNAQWDFANNTLNNVDALNSNSVSTNASDTDELTVNFEGDFSEAERLVVPSNDTIDEFINQTDTAGSIAVVDGLFTIRTEDA